MFPGGSRRNINLGGRSKKKEDNISLISRLERERLKRHQSRERSSAALTIQSFYRGRCDVSLFKSILRHDWDIQMEKLSLLPSHITSAIPFLFPMLRTFLFFHHPYDDMARFCQICRLVLTSCSLGGAANFFNPLDGETITPNVSVSSFIFQMGNLVRSCVRVIASKRSDMDALLLAIRVCTILIGHNDGGGDDDVTYKSTMIRRCSGLMNAIGEKLMGGVSSGMVRLVVCWMKLMMKEKSISLSLEMSDLYSSVLGNESFRREVEMDDDDDGHHHHHHHHHRLLFSNGLLCMTESPPKEVMLDSLIWVGDCLMDMKMDVRTSWFRCISEIMMMRVMESSSNISSDDDDDGGGGGGGGGFTKRQRLTTTTMDELVGKIHHDVFTNDNSKLPCLFKDTMMNGSSQHVISICSFVNALQHSCCCDDLLNALGWDRTIVRDLWMIVKDHVRMIESTSSLTSSMILVTSFCTLYSRLLRVLDDVEFNDGKVFSLEENGRMAKMMNELVFKLVSTSSHRHVEEELLFNQVVKLTRELHDRNSRLMFTPVDTWIIPSIHPSTHPSDVILSNSPWMYPLISRVGLFRDLIQKDLESIGSSSTWGWGGGPSIRIRRDKIVEDGFDQLWGLPDSDLKGRIRVTLVDFAGMDEAGVDGGGLWKEFIIELCKSSFNPDFGLFQATPDQLLWPNPHALSLHPDAIRLFEFLGLIIGKAVYDGILVEVSFANAFLGRLLGKHAFHNDLACVDPTLHRNLMFVKHYDGDVEELGLTFSHTVERLGERIHIDLKPPSGLDTPVTRQNRIEYTFLLSHYLLHTQIRPQASAFLRGFSRLIKPSWLSMFDQHELHLLIAGTEGGIDVDDLRRNVHYGGHYNDDNDTIISFWNVLREMSPEDQRALLKFVTSCSRPPLLGFSSLNPKLTIAPSSPDIHRLPTASTCMNLLKLPPYNTDECLLREKLLYAIHSNAGFDLS